MSRKKKLVLNTLMGLIKQIVTLICGFIVPRFLLLYYGSEVNGLISSITSFLGFITLLDMGVGTVIQSNLYEPLANNDNKRLNAILKSSSKFFNRLGMIFIIYIIVLVVVYPKCTNSPLDSIFIVSLIIILSISTIAQYLFGITYQLLLNADQKAYIPLLISTVTIALNAAITVTLILMGCNVIIVKMVGSIIYVSRPIIQNVYVKKHYSIDRSISVDGEPIKQKWNGFAQHLAAVICQNIDVVVLTIFSTLDQVSVYSVYFMIIYGIEQIVLTATTGLDSLFGNMIANGEKESLNRLFSISEWLTHFVVTIIFSISLATIVPFVTVYTRGITDVNYNVPVFGILLTLAYAFLCIRVPYFKIIKSAGHFKETQNGAFISAIINVIITVGTVFKFGLIGVAIGTIAAMLYHTCYLVWYLRKQIIHRSMRKYLVYLCIDMCIFLFSIFISQRFCFVGTTYYEWVIYVLKIMCPIIGLSFFINLIFCNKYMKKILKCLIIRNKG